MALEIDLIVSPHISLQAHKSSSTALRHWQIVMCQWKICKSTTMMTLHISLTNAGGWLPRTHIMVVSVYQLSYTIQVPGVLLRHFYVFLKVAQTGLKTWPPWQPEGPQIPTASSKTKFLRWGLTAGIIEQWLHFAASRLGSPFSLWKFSF